MTPTDYLNETFRSVKETLAETLRFDYGPNNSDEFFKECSDRLGDIEKELSLINAGDSLTISARISELESLGMWIALIERSHLGEFSWPFADHIRAIATLFLSEPLLNGGLLEPIIHIAAEGSGYQIHNEPRIPATTSRRRFAVIKFPRQFKDNVLLHVLFGHELGHTSIFTTQTGDAVNKTVVSPFIFGSLIQTTNSINAWLADPQAPREIKDILALHAATTGAPFLFPQTSLESWWIEFICDLFGLLLFGPAFVAAHKALILSSQPSPFVLMLTHPPYAARHRMLIQSLKFLNWDNPILRVADESENYAAEKTFYDYTMDDPYNDWCDVFPAQNLHAAITAIRAILAPFNIEYSKPDPVHIFSMTNRLSRGIPPLCDTIDADGKPVLLNTPVGHILYAGWVYWIGRTKFKNGLPLSFLHTNGLCNQALLQQVAINYLKT